MNELGYKKRPWGFYDTISHHNENYNEINHFVRYLEFNPGEELSVSKHEYRDEFWLVLTGCAIVTIDDEETCISAGDHIIVKCGQKHHIMNPSSSEVLTILEVAYGEKACDSDIIRISDKYGR